MTGRTESSSSTEVWSGQGPHIALVIYSLGSGGAERVLANMANYWQARGRQVTVINLVGRQDPDTYPLIAGVNRIWLDVGKPSGNILQAIFMNLVRIRRLRANLARLRPDVVISFMNTVNALTLLASAGLRLPVIISERVDLKAAQVPRFWRLLIRLTFPSADLLILQNPEFAGAYPASMRQRIRAIPNPVHPPPAVEGAAAVRLNKPVMLTAARLTARKGVDILLLAFQNARAAHPEWHLAILGEGPLRAELEALAKSLGIEDAVTFLGWMDDPYPYFRQADLFVLASKYEGFPNALCEAMACGLAVIASDSSPAVREIVRAEVDGLLVPVNEPERLAAAMGRLMADERLRRRYGARGQEIVHRYDAATIMRAWESAVADVMRARAS